MKDGIVILHIHACVYCKTYEKVHGLQRGEAHGSATVFIALLKNSKQLTGNIYKIYIRTTQIDCNSFIQYTITHRAQINLFHAVLGHVISFKFLDLFKLTSNTNGHNVAVNFLFSPMVTSLAI